jgi:hypothetical protein
LNLISFGTGRILPIVKTSLSAVVCSLTTIAVSSAITVVDDGFELADHPTGFRTVANPANGGVAFLASASAPAISLGADAVLGSNALLVTPTAQLNHNVIAPLGGSISLTTIGDYAELNFRFRFLNTPTVSSSAFRFGLFNSNGTAVSDGAFGTNDDNDIGYYMVLGNGATSAGTTGDAAVFDEAGGTDPILGGTDRSAVIASPTVTGVSVPGGDQTAHSVMFRLERTAAGTISISYRLDSGTTYTVTDNTTLRTTFDEIAFSNNFASAPATVSQYAIDDVVLTASNFTIVPEPTVGALTGLGLLLFFRRKR